MGKWILFSVVAASVVLPLRAARDPDARRGLRRALVQTLVFDALFALAALFVYPRV